MGAPTPTARQTPTGGVAQREGFHAHITLGNAPSIAFWEKDAQPPGVEGGEPIDQTTQFNTAVRTRFPRVLHDFDPINVNAAYSPVVYSDIVAQINVNQVITVSFPDTMTICFWGYLRSFKPAALAEGQQPMCSIVIVPTNLDNSYVEQVPVLSTAIPGT